MAELWDAYDAGFNKLDNVTLARGETIPDGVFHLVCEVAVKHKEGQYLLMQRDFRKSFGGLWELTASGAAKKGETPIACAVRELEEETGIHCNDLEEIGRVVHMNTHSIYMEYLCFIECDKESVLLQEGETVNYRWVEKEELKNDTELASDRMLLFIEELQ